ncbi:hypothetical protein LSH36_127g04020 [Paralvinella palmiformis]|uniref:ADP-ribosylation factor-binding protein GGA1 n=1 Tax=Paralvinella palmiformis TaxID=53620 RepID=A0AAD9JXJ9_9ANNE|nr:hypothetical protein LSH36_127g04020 [Paralvinella palmiformis]
MAAQEGETLETLLTRATNPLNKEEDWDFIMAFCDQINKELEGPQIAVRLLAHKIQSPQEKEALFALSALEACVKNCGRRFHQEIGKFRFLNEVIKVVSPKYLGNYTSEKVKKKCIELLYSWSHGLPNEGKVTEAYQMLKRQGIVKTDPTYVDKTLEPPPPPRSDNSLFEDEEKSKLLSRLLKSNHPEDLQAANRLIKHIVKQDAERMEKVSKRMQQIETVNNNIKVLKEMLTHYKESSASEAEKDLMKELYQNLEKARPNLFRLASDTDEKDNEGISEILKTNDEVLEIMNLYKNTVEGADISSEQQSALLPSDLLDFGNFSKKTDSSRNIPNLASTKEPCLLDSESNTNTNLNIDPLGLIDMNSEYNDNQGASVMSQLNKNDLDILSDIFTSSSSTSSALASSSGSADIKILNLDSAPVLPGLYQPPVPAVGSNTLPLVSGSAATTINWQSATVNSTTGQLPLAPSVSVTAKTEQPSTETKGLDVLNELGKSLMEQSLSSVSASGITVPVTATQPLTLNQIAAKPVTSTVSSGLSGLSQNSLTTIGTASPLATPPISATASPARTGQKQVDIQPLTDISVPLESIQPSSHSPITAYDKNNIKAVIHIGKDRPRPDVCVMVLSIISMNTSSIKNISFQAAVPKIMKVKLQPPSATDLPAYNPILPPTAVTQVILIANPLKEKIRLKFKLTYLLDNKSVSDVGEVDTFAVQ